MPAALILRASAAYYPTGRPGRCTKARLLSGGDNGEHVIAIARRVDRLLDHRNLKVGMVVRLTAGDFTLICLT